MILVDDAPSVDNSPGPGGGGAVLTPNFGRYVPRQSEKMARAPERAPGRAWKLGSPELTSLSRFELENGGLRNELEPFWAWKCGAPERPLTRGAAERLKMRISGTAANPRRCRTLENANLRNGRYAAALPNALSRGRGKRWTGWN